MGKSKKSKGSKPKGPKGPKGSKGKGKKGKGKKKTKSKKKIQEDFEPPPPPDLNTFVYVRRQNLTLCLETHEEETVKELKIQVSAILRQFPEDIALFAMLGKKEEEMEEKEKEKKEEEKKDDRSGSRGRGAKDKEKEQPSNSPPKPPGDMTVGKYGYNPRTASVFSPATIGLAYRGDDGEFEKVEITPYGEFPVIPEEIKMHLRNYVPPPPPPAKKGGGGGGNVKK